MADAPDRLHRPPAPKWALLGEIAPLGAVAAACVAALLFLPQDLAFLTRVLATAFLVISLDLVTGLGGIATLGQATLFGAGAYLAGWACARGLVTEPVLLLGLGLLGGAAAGFVMGAVVVRAHGLAQLVLSIAIVQLATEAANKAASVTGGSDGLAGIFPGHVLGRFPFDLWGRTGFGLAAVALVLTLAILRLVVRSPFGLLCKAIRHDAGRVEAMGAPVLRTLLRLHTLAGAVAGLGGALSAMTAGVVGLDSIGFERSAEALVMLVLGGMGTLYGALLGALVFMTAQHLLAAVNPFHWLILIGALLIVVVIFLPRGLQAPWAAFRPRRRRALS